MYFSFLAVDGFDLEEYKNPLPKSWTKTHVKLNIEPQSLTRQVYTHDKDLQLKDTGFGRSL